MKKYEYKIIAEKMPNAENLEDSIMGIEEILNMYGDEGWKAFYYDEGIYTKTGDEGMLIFLMRKKENE